MGDWTITVTGSGTVGDGSPTDPQVLAQALVGQLVANGNGTVTSATIDVAVVTETDLLSAVGG